MSSPCRPRAHTLEIPDYHNNAASPSGASSATQTGRPTLWKTSAQRKMTRLYVYTTLPLQKILDVVYSTSPLEAVPGKDSANKKLNANLDKEPRWLHPRTDTDMGRRLNELSRSPARTPAMSDGHVQRRHATSDPSPLPQFHDIKMEAGLSPAAHEVVSIGNWSASPNDDPTSQAYGVFSNDSSLPPLAAQAPRGSTAPPIGNRPKRTGSDLLNSFLRRTSIMTSSTDRSNGDFHRLLSDYPEPYIQTVRRLVKRFTLNVNQRMSMSPISERPMRSWVDDAPSYYSLEPYPLPGDFLVPENPLLGQVCSGHSEQHISQTCMCFLIGPQSSSPWITSGGLTPVGQRILSAGVAVQDVAMTDSCGNTVLHFLAARGDFQLVHLLPTELCAPILNATNTAGQTFLHVLSRNWISSKDHLLALLQILRSQNFDVYAQDLYGRNFFHILRLVGTDLSDVLPDWDRSRYAKRDAFNNIPSIEAQNGTNLDPLYSVDSMDLDPSSLEPFSDLTLQQNEEPEVARESSLLRQVRLATEQPQHEDENGGNGLHCLALASLSFSNVSSKASPMSRASFNPPAGPERPKKDLDSSKERLELRLSLVKGLVEANVDVNHYDNDGNTPLMAFAAQLPEEDDYRTGPKILEYLIDNGANINARNRTGETALHIAVRCGRKLAVRTLVKKEANVHVRDAGGRSLLDVADFKMASSNAEIPKEYSHFEACRAWLSGQGRAVQCPTSLQEWTMPNKA